jgi:gliding motility-associated-like protein
MKSPMQSLRRLFSSKYLVMATNKVPMKQLFTVFAAVVTSLSVFASGEKNNKDGNPLVQEKHVEVPKIQENGIRFIENKGQWPGHVLFRADVPGGQMLATPQGMLVAKYDEQSLKANAAYMEREEEYQRGKITKAELGEPVGIKGHGWRLNFVNAAPATMEMMERKGKSNDYFNFLVGDVANHATNVYSYNELTYKNVYPGVNVRYYTSPVGDFENDIVVAPGADYSKIAFMVEGVQRVTVNGNGDLVFGTTVGEQTIPAAVSYLIDAKGKRTSIDVKFKLVGENTIGFDIPKYDATQTLVIDPIVMRWATLISGASSSDAHFHGIDVDASGNIFATGRYNGGLTTVGAFQTSNSGTDLFISKYTEPATPGGAGSRVWQTYLGNSGTDNPYALTLGRDGYLYIVGSSGGSMTKTYGTGFSAGSWTQRGGSGQTFIAKVHPNGTGAAVRTLGTSSSDWGVLFYDVRVLPTTGNAFDLICVGVVTENGTSVNGDIPQATQPNGTSVTNTGHENGYAVRITSDLETLVWTKQYGSSAGDDDQFNICVIDNQSNVIIGGFTQGASGISYSNPSTQTTRTGDTDGWLMRLNAANGNALWSRYFNAGSGNDATILCMETNTAKTQLIIGGRAIGALASANITSGAYQTTYGGSNDFFVASLPIGATTTTWGTYFGGSGNEVNMMGLNVDQNGDIYVLGYSDSKNIATVDKPVQNASYDTDDQDAVFFKLSSAGNSVLYHTYLGGTNDETDPVGQRGIKFSDCRIYLPITTYSTNFPLTQGTLTDDKTSGGSIGEPVLISMANPPDLQGNSITSGANQTITCGGTPAPITASVPTYIIAGIQRDEVNQTNGTNGAYPDGLPVISSYQWQSSTDNGATWTSIPGATSQNYTPPAIYVNGTTKYRRIINGDACNRASDTLAVVTIIVTPSVATPTITSSSPDCVGETISLTASSTTPNVTYAWTGPSSYSNTGASITRPNATLAMAGTYSVIATAANGCKSNAGTTNVVVNSSPAITGTSSNPSTCGATNGSITLSGLSANTLYSVSYVFNGGSPTTVGITSNGSGQVIISNLAGGAYTNVNVTLGGCTSNSLSFTLTNPAPPAAPTNVNASPNPICTGNTLTLTATGSNLAWTGPGSYTASGSPATRAITSTTQGGTYSVTQTVNGCTSPAATVNVTVNQTPTITAATPTNPTTCSGSNGSIAISGTAGTILNNTNYSVTYTKNGGSPTTVTLTSNGSGVITITGLTAGTYTNISITLSGTSCASNTFAGPVTLTDPITPSAPTNVTASPNPICTGNTLTLSATGSNLSWTGPASYTATGSPVTRSITSTTQGGTYSVTQTVNNCTSPAATVSVTVNQTPTITAANGTNPTTCSGSDGSIAVSGTAGTILNNTNYSVTYTKNGGSPTTVTLTSNGSGVITITGLTAGTYTNISSTLSGTSCASNTFAGPVTLTDPTTPAAPTNVSASPNPICTGNTLTLSATGSNLSWTGPGGYTASGSPATRAITSTTQGGTYSVTQTVNNCTSPAATVSVTVNQTPTITAANGTNPTTCSGSNGSIAISGTAGTILNNTNYSVTYTKNGGSPTTVTLTSNGSGVITITGLTAGTYTNISITLSGTSCASNTFAGPVTLTDPTPPSSPTNVSATPNPICTGNTLTLSATGTNLAWTGPASYTASGSPVTRAITSTTQGGTYSVTQTVNNCTSPAATVSVTVNQTPVIGTVTPSNPTTCSGSDGSLTLSGLVASTTYSVTYARNGSPVGPVSLATNGAGALTISGLTAGSYTNIIVTLNGCPSAPVAGPIVLVDPSTPAAPTNVSASPNPICTGNTLTLTATGSNLSWTGPLGYTASGSPATRAITLVTQGGVYSVTQTVNNCTSPPANVTVTVNATPSITSTSSTNPTTCGGTEGTITLNGLNNNTSYLVNYLRNSVAATPQTLSTNGSGQLVITGLTAGTYSNITVTLTGCTSAPVGPITLTDPSNPSAPVLSSSSPDCYGDTLKLFATTVVNATYSWSGPGGFTSSSQNPVRPNATPAMSGSYSLTVTVNNCNSAPVSTTATVTSCPPVAVNDNYTTNEDQTLNVPAAGVLTNDSDPANPQQPLTVTTTPTCNPVHGSVTLNANGSFTYVPTANYNGLDSFCYRVCDTEIPAACDTAKVFITVVPVNDPPVINDSTVTTPEDVPITVCLPITDLETSTQTHSVTVCGSPANGTISGLTVNNVGNPHTVCFTYTPDVNFNGTNTLCLTVCDDGSPQGCDNATVTIIVTPVNDPPVANNDTYSANEDSPLTVSAPGVLTNDSDPIDGTPVTVVGVIAQPTNGTVTLNANGSFTYTPNANFTGTDQFCYSITDAGTPAPFLLDTACVTITVNPVNDPPVVNDSTVTTPEDVPITVCLPITDPESATQLHSVTLCGGPANGSLNGTLGVSNGSIPHTVCFTYTPNADFNGTNTVCLIVCDNGSPSRCDTATVTIIVTPVNDPPVAVDDYFTNCTGTNITGNVMANDSATDGPFVTVIGPLSGPVTGSLTLGGTGAFTYTPSSPLFNSLDSFVYVICDGGSPILCDTAKVILDYTCVNVPPIARDDNYTVNEDQTLTVSVPGIMTNDNDPDGGVITVTTPQLTGTNHGTLTLNANGSFTYVPNTNYNGLDTFQYSICDNGSPVKCDTAFVYINVLPVNDPPQVPDTTITTCEDCGPVTVCLGITDVETNQDYYVAGLVCGPNSGSYSTSVNNVSNQLCVTYTSNTNFNGTDSLCVVLCDNGTPNLCDTSKIVIIVTPVNDPPIANNDAYTTTEDNPITVTAPGVLTNDSDPADGTAVTVVGVVSQPTNGTVTLNANGSFVYTPNANFFGTDVFCYNITDAGTPAPFLLDTACVTITVTPVNDPPQIPDTTVTTCEDCPITVCVPFTDNDVTDLHGYTTLCNPTNGSLSSVSISDINDVLCFTYTGTTNFNGTDSVCFIVCDNGIPTKCDTTTITIIVTPVNDPPVAVNDFYTTNEDTPLNVPTGTGVRINDNDNADGNPVTSLTIDNTPITGPANGTLTLSGTGSFVYTPNANFFGVDSFVYRVCDSGTPPPSLCDTATAYITVVPDNDPPQIPDTTVTTCEDCPITVCVPITDEETSTQVHVAFVCGTPLHGSINIPSVNNASNPHQFCTTYTPSTNYNGTDSFCVIVCDNGVPIKCDTSTITIIVTPVNDPPVANNDSYTTNEDTPLNVPAPGVQTNDSDPDGTTLTTTVVTSTSNGSLTLNTNGSFTYTPNSNFFGTDTFFYSACDAGIPLPSLCDTAMVVITVNSQNDPPVVPDSTVTTPEDTPITVCIPISDNDLGQQYIANLCGIPANGLITFGPVVNNGVNPTVCITYSPNANFNGLDSLCLTVCDNGIPTLCDNSIIRIIVTPVNDPPVAVNDNYTTNEDTPLNVPTGTGVRANDNDNADGNPVTSLVVTTTPLTGTSNGTLTLTSTGSFVYTPNPNFFGTDSFVYRVCDSGTPPPSLCDTATAYITVVPVNDPPEIPDTVVTTCEDCPINICIPFTDNDTLDVHTQVSLCPGQLGTVTGVTINQTTNFLCYTYTPYLNITGSDTVCFIVCDNGVPSKCDTTTTTITIYPVNDPPYADTIYVVTYENQPVGVNVASATGDPEGNPLTYSYGSVTPNNGTYGITGNGALVVIPNTGFTGTFTIPYGVCDLSPYLVNVLCDSAAIVVTVLPAGDTLINHAPVASNDYVTTPLNTSVVVNQLANDYDPDGDALAVTVTCAPKHGNYTLNGTGTINYFPNTGFFGYDTICYTICDPTAAKNPKPLCDNAIVVIYISTDSTSIENDAPVAVDDFEFICADENAVFNVLSNDNDPNGDAITGVTLVSGVTNGTLVNAGQGLYVYTPGLATTYSDTFYYSICDNGSPSLCDTAMAVVFVNATPVITPSVPSATVCSGDAVNVSFTSNVPGTVITWTGSNGTSGTGNISTTLTNNTSVDQVVTYTVTGSSGAGCAATTITVPVTVKPRPVAAYTANGSIFCAGDQIIINANSNIAGTTYAWTGTNGSSGTGSLITDNPTNVGPSDSVVTYTITPTYNGCTGTALTVNVTVKPRPTLTAAPTTQTVCSGTAITVGISSSVPGTSFFWTGSNGNSGNSATINDSPFNLGTTDITVTYTINGSFNGCSAPTITSTVVVRPRVVADAGADKSVTSCSSSCVTLGGSPTGSGGSGALTYAWSPSANVNDTTLANPTACGLSSATTFTVTVTDAFGCSATDQVSITTTPNPLAAEAGAGGALCLGSGDSVTLGGFPTAVGGAAPYTYTWSPSAGLNLTNPANPEAFPTATTKYYLTVTDQNGCQSVDSTTVTVYPVLVADAGADTIVCSGSPFQLGGTPTATGGSGSGYTYVWSPTSGLNNINSANPTGTATSSLTYAVTVTDGNGCSATDNVIVTINASPTAQAGPDKNLAVCPNDSVIIGDFPAAIGGTGPYTYRWTPSFGLSDTTVPNPSVKNIFGTQTYTLLVTDANGCTSTDNVTVNVIPNNLQAFAGNNRTICSGTCVQIGGFPVVNGGYPPFSFLWTGGEVVDSTLSNPVVCPSANTTYLLTITDDKGCTATSSVTITVNPNPVANAGVDTFVCAGLSVPIGGAPTASQGTGPYTYTWTPTVGLSLPNVSNPSASPLTVTTYSVTVTDSKGCSATDAVTVTPRTNPVVNAGADKTLTACAGDTTFIGGIPVVTSGGTAPYTYVWTPATALSDDSVQNPLVTGLSATTSYQIVVTDTFGCKGSDFVIVNVLPSTLQADAGNSGVVCAAANTPVQLGGNPTATGGTPPYVYHWNPSAGLSDTAAANPIATVSSSTTFYVTVTDAKGCISIDSVTVTQNTAPTANAGADTTICEGFGVILGGTPTTTSGTGPFQYSWTPTQGLNNNNTANPLATPLVTTVYSVLVTDSNGCQITDNITVTVRQRPTANAGVDKTITTCAGDSVQIGGTPAASGGAPGYTYVWGPATGLSDDSIANPYVAGISASQLYALTVTDANGCTAVDAMLMTVVPSSLVAEAGNGGTICENSGVLVQLGGIPTATGGATPYNYAWSGGLPAIANPQVSPTATTTYYVTVTDAKGCVSVDSVTVTVNPNPVACAGNDTAICFGAKLRLGCSPTASGGTSPYTYLWSNGSQASNPNVGVNTTTIFTVTVTDATGCSATSSRTVTVNPNPVVNAGADQNLVGCSQDSVQIGGSPSASGGTAPYVYSWNPTGGLTDDSIANPFVKNIGSTTTYTLLVVDQNGCAGVDQVKVNVANSTLVAEAGNNVAFCQGSAVNVTLGGNPTAVGGSPSYTYTWTPAGSLNLSNVANPVASPTQTTTYTVVVTDGNGCFSQDTVKITINPRPDVNAGVNDTICAGACVTLGGTPTAAGGTGSTYTYNWGPAFFSSTATNIANPVVCPTGNITYAVTVTDSIGCSNIANVSIKVNQNPVANAGADQATVFCTNACVQLGGSPTATQGTAPYVYAWSPSSFINNTGLPNPSVCNVTTGTTNYTVTVTDINGCTATDVVTVNSSPSNLTASAGVDKSICAGGSTCITIGGTPTVSGGTGPISISWSPLAGICNSNTISNPEVNPNDTTTYTVLVQDAQGCIAVDSMVVFANPAVTASVGADTAICEGGAALLGGNPTGSGGTAPYTYLWSPSGGLSSLTSSNPTASPSIITAYCVTVTDAVGCTASTCQRVSVNPAVTANAGPDRTITACVGSTTQLGGSPTGTGGSGNYSYVWSPDSIQGVQVLIGKNGSNPFVTGLNNTTTFTVTVTDNVTGCFGTDQVTVFVNQTTLTASAGPDVIYCANKPVGTQIGGNPTAQGGQFPYIYQWGPALGLSDASVANPLASPTVTTTYYVTVTDNLGCSKEDSVVVTVGPQIAVNAGTDTIICYGTNLVLGGTPTALGGTSPFTYAWNPSQFLTSTTVANPTAQNVTSNITYTVVVTDSFGCQAEDFIVVGTRALPTANAGPDVSIFACTGDSAVLGGAPTASGTQGPYTYSWNPPLNQSLSSLTASNPIVSNLGFTTQFCVTVTDTFGCVATDCQTTTVLPNTVFVEAGVNVGSLCSNTGGCVTLGGSPAVTGGQAPYTFQWVGNVNDPTAANPQACPTGTTTYTLIATDQNGCQATDTVQVVVNTPPTAAIAGLDSQYCVSAGSVSMTGIPAGGTFSGPGVTGNVFQPSVVGAGNWCITYSYTDPSTGCTDDTVVCVNVYQLPVVSVSSYNASYCVYEPADTLVGTPAGGTFSGPGMSGDVFTPATANIGNNVIAYTYTDTLGGCTNSVQITIQVKPAPTVTVVANDDSACVNQPVLLSPQYSFDVTNIQWSQLGGSVFASGLNPVTVTPTGVDYCVVATAISNSTGCSASDTICLHVNQLPVATNDSAFTCEDESVIISVQTNDTDAEGDANTVRVITVLHGTGNVVNGSIVYAPNANYNGGDTLTYSLCNTQCSNDCDTATVYINITPQNDVPVAGNGFDTILQSQTSTVCPVITDVDGDPLTISIVPNVPVNGTVSIVNGCVVFVPTPGWIGTQVITYQACDEFTPSLCDGQATSTCDTGTVTITVLPGNNPPIALKVGVIVCANTPVGINVGASATDPDGNPLTFSYGAVSTTSGGTGTYTVTGNGAIVFQGSAVGTYTIPYFACDQSNLPISPLCDTATITIYVVNCDSNTNHPPVASDDAVIVTVGDTVVVNELANDFDPDGDTLSVTVIGGPNLPGATATLNPDNTVSYTSPVTGVDSITYVICDPFNACDTAVIYVIVDSVQHNNPPIAVNDYTITGYKTPKGVPVTINDSDPDGDTFTVTGIPCPPSLGTAVIVGNVVVYTPGPGANALNPDTFCYVICDNGSPSLCDTATVVVTIDNSVVAVNDTLLTGPFHPITIDVMNNDFDPETDSFYVTGVITTNTVGTVTLNPDGTVSFVPNTDTCGFVDQFQYVIQDVLGAVDTATVFITIDCCPRPEANQDNVIVLPGDQIAVNVVTNDQANGLAVKGKIISGPFHGTAVFTTDSALVYTSDVSYCGFDSIFYSIESHCGIDTSLVLVNVYCNVKPDAVTDTVTVCLNSVVTFNPTLNDVDSNANQLAISGINPPFGVGAFSVNGNTISFTSVGVTGTFTMQYYICDNGLPSLCDTGLVILNVITCNQTVDTIPDTTFINTPVGPCIGAYVNSFTPLFISSICDPDNGSVTYQPGDTCFTYLPDTNFVGNDVFCIVLCDSAGNNCVTSTVIITVLDTLIQAVDEPCDLDTTYKDTPITLDVLANDIIPFGLDTAVTVPAVIDNATAVVNTDNTVTVTPNAGYTGNINFDYIVCVTTGPFSYCDTASVCVTVIDTNRYCFLPNGFSPNGDGVNDNYVIPCQDENPEATLRVFNRWGVEVWRSEGPYKNDWNGNNMQGVKCPDGTYFAIYELNNGTGKRQEQFVVIHR